MGNTQSKEPSEDLDTSLNGDAIFENINELREDALRQVSAEDPGRDDVGTEMDPLVQVTRHPVSNPSSTRPRSISPPPTKRRRLGATDSYSPSLNHSASWTPDTHQSEAEAYRPGPDKVRFTGEPHRGRVHSAQSGYTQDLPTSRRGSSISIDEKLPLSSPPIRSQSNGGYQDRRQGTNVIHSNTFSDPLSALDRHDQGNNPGFDFSKVPRGPWRDTVTFDDLTDPHIFITSETVPVLSSTVKHLRALFKRQSVIPKQIKLDQDGYYVFFENSTQGVDDLRRCLDNFDRRLLFNQYEMRMRYMRGRPKTTYHPGLDNSPYKVQSNPPPATKDDPLRRVSDRTPQMSPIDSNSNSVGAGFTAGDRSRPEPNPRGRLASSFKRIPDTGSDTVLEATTSTIQQPTTATTLDQEYDVDYRRELHNGEVLHLPSQNSNQDLPDRVPASIPDETSRLKSEAIRRLSIPDHIGVEEGQSSPRSLTPSDISSATARKYEKECHRCKQPDQAHNAFVKCVTCVRRFHDACRVPPPGPSDTLTTWQCNHCKKKGREVPVVQDKRVPESSKATQPPSAPSLTLPERLAWDQSEAEVMNLGEGEAETTAGAEAEFTDDQSAAMSISDGVSKQIAIPNPVPTDLTPAPATEMSDAPVEPQKSNPKEVDTELGENISNVNPVPTDLTPAPATEMSDAPMSLATTPATPMLPEPMPPEPEPFTDNEMADPRKRGRAKKTNIPVVSTRNLNATLDGASSREYDLSSPSIDDATLLVNASFAIAQKELPSSSGRGTSSSPTKTSTLGQCSSCGKKMFLCKAGTICAACKKRQEDIEMQAKIQSEKAIVEAAPSMNHPLPQQIQSAGSTPRDLQQDKGNQPQFALPQKPAAVSETPMLDSLAKDAQNATSILNDVLQDKGKEKQSHQPTPLLEPAQRIPKRITKRAPSQTSRSTVKLSEASKYSGASKPSEAPRPSEVLESSGAPKPLEAPKPSKAPRPPETSKPSEAPKPSEATKPLVGSVLSKPHLEPAAEIVEPPPRDVNQRQNFQSETLETPIVETSMDSTTDHVLSQTTGIIPSGSQSFKPTISKEVTAAVPISESHSSNEVANSPSTTVPAPKDPITRSPLALRLTRNPEDVFQGRVSGPIHQALAAMADSELTIAFRILNDTPEARDNIQTFRNCLDAFARAQTADDEADATQAGMRTAEPQNRGSNASNALVTDSDVSNSRRPKEINHRPNLSGQESTRSTQSAINQSNESEKITAQANDGNVAQSQYVDSDEAPNQRLPRHFSLSQVCALALLSTPSRRLSHPQICNWISSQNLFKYRSSDPTKWKTSMSAILSGNVNFERTPAMPGDDGYAFYTFVKGKAKDFKHLNPKEGQVEEGATASQSLLGSPVSKKTTLKSPKEASTEQNHRGRTSELRRDAVDSSSSPVRHRIKPTRKTTAQTTSSRVETQLLERSSDAEVEQQRGQKRLRRFSPRHDDDVDMEEAPNSAERASRPTGRQNVASHYDGYPTIDEMIARHVPVEDHLWNLSDSDDAFNPFEERPSSEDGDDELLALIDSNDEKAEFEDKDLFAVRPELHPDVVLLDFEARRQEIEARPTRKQLNGHFDPVPRADVQEKYGVLPHRVRGKQKEIELPVLEDDDLGNLGGDEAARPRSERWKVVNTIEDAFELPDDMIKFTYEGQLAWRDGTRVNGELPRPKTVYKVGRVEESRTRSK
ncbi:hypothetical protein NA57DRAFT_74134 [Rhizodiscina lignyota]|uniref:Fork-head domain-containing protein n=1 Tax=Rhizodiscina lignyota TaxID=1504668 RepID=A0A9P4M7K5_9PEZI|nr:hypothetical protein NA57DRAFT_74134 [Rhizodiscina lignyota]